MYILPSFASVEYCRPICWHICSTRGFIFWTWLAEWLPLPTMLNNGLLSIGQDRSNWTNLTRGDVSARAAAHSESFVRGYLQLPRQTGHANQSFHREHGQRHYSPGR